jgi:hypothetical protein
MSEEVRTCVQVEGNAWATAHAITTIAYEMMNTNMKMNLDAQNVEARMNVEAKAGMDSAPTMQAMTVIMEVTMRRRMVEEAPGKGKSEFDKKENVDQGEPLPQLHGSLTLAHVLRKETSTTKI